MKMRTYSLTNLWTVVALETAEGSTRRSGLSVAEKGNPEWSLLISGVK